MMTRPFENGDSMPALGLGTWKSDPGEVYKAVKEAIRIGYRHIDCAPIYGNEAEVGQALDESLKEGAVARERLWVTSKLWNDAHAPENVRSAVEKTLQDLRLSHLDLLLIHWPVALRHGVVFPKSGEDFVSLDDLPILQTWAAMETLVDEGICRHIGVSNFSVAKLDGLTGSARMKPEMNQIELHPYLQQPSMMDYCRTKGILLTAYSPLGSVDRPSALKAEDEPVLLEDAVIGRIAERRGATPAQVLIAWALHRNTAVIPKSVHPERMRENLAAADLSLTSEDLQEIADLDRHRRYVDGSFWTMGGSPYTLENLWDE